MTETRMISLEDAIRRRITVKPKSFSNDLLFIIHVLARSLQRADSVEKRIRALKELQGNHAISQYLEGHGNREIVAHLRHWEENKCQQVVTQGS
jgi:hypothetical protein